MIEVRWNQFRAKFEGHEDKAFELLCYLLFLREHNLPEKGLFGYYNQIGIETEPVLIDGEWVGFQAKYSDSQVSTAAIRDSLTKARRKHPDLQKVVVYTNTEFSETRKTTVIPEAQSEVEKFATGLNLKIEWRVRSNFTALLSQAGNQDLAEHFFSLDPGRYGFIEELKRHTQEILNPIRTSIEFQDALIKLDRSSASARLKSLATPSRIIIIHGPGGVGKTALIRDFFESLKNKAPLVVFKASEFNLRHINDLFSSYGGRSLSYFIDAFAKADKKYLVVDSAEKLSDLDDHDAFREFLTGLTASGWTVLLTTRDAYVDSLAFQLMNVYGRTFEKVGLSILEESELATLATENSFTLPSSHRLLDLIRNPFYLAEYLQLSAIGDSGVTFDDFKQTLWRKKIQGLSSKGTIDRRREEAFLAAARHRANSGGFAMPTGDADAQALRALEVDEVLGFDKGLGGYFITHDIYEEWALATIIERSFGFRKSTVEFFESIGSSLPMRRAFRQWLSECLRDRREFVRAFVEDAIVNNELARHWRDEGLISVLRSDYSSTFFEMFERLLLANDCNILIRLMFLLRTGCKEVDTQLIRRVKEFSKDASSDLMITAPVGKGWPSAIGFIHGHIDEISHDYLPAVVSVLEDWSFTNKTGPATRSAGLIALSFYQNFVDEDRYGNDEMLERLIAVIFNCATEIKSELELILEEVVGGGAIEHRQRHYQLVKTLLSDAVSGHQVATTLPVKTMRIAELYWLRAPKRRYDYTLGIEKYFDIGFEFGNEYFPASAFQTPMLAFLRGSPIEAFGFLHSFNEKTIGHYVRTDLDVEAEEIELSVDGTNVAQLINSRIWNIYRATQGAPYLLDSLHMALERYLLEIAELESADLIAGICKRLMRDSKFASVTAVVASVVLAQPDKLFKVAKILFRNRAVILHDNERKMHDSSARNLYSIPSPHLPDAKLHVDERLATCDQPHRSWSLEDLARNYQFFDYSGDPQIFQKRQEEIWDILDRHYAELPPEEEQGEADKVWRMALARMDRRKMAPTVEKEEDGDRLIVSFNPKIESGLQSFREDGSAMVAAFMKFIPLKLWAMERFEKRATESPYDTDPSLALNEAREILDRGGDTEESDGRGRFWLFNGSTPVYVCAVLLRDHAESLSEEEKDFCASLLLDAALIPHARSDYFYQAMDGTEPAISSLANVFNKTPQYAEEAKQSLFLSLLNHGTEVSTFAKRSLFASRIWETHANDVQSLLIGFIILKPRYDEIAEEFWRGRHSFPGPDADAPAESASETLAERFAEACGSDIERVIRNEIVSTEVGDLGSYPVAVAASALELLPLDTDDPLHMNLISTVASALAERDAFEEADKQSGFMLKFRTLQKFASLVISSPAHRAVEYVGPFIENYRASAISDVFKQLIFAEDELKQYESFWTVWQAFFPKVVTDSHAKRWEDRPNPAIRNYLLGGELWKEDAKAWPSLKDREKLFYQAAVRELGHHPSAFFAIARFLNEIGSPFVADGVAWISDLLGAGKSRSTQNPEPGTVQYLENIVRRYAEVERRTIRRSPEVRNRVIRILDYLVENGSVSAFLLRDQLA